MGGAHDFDLYRLLVEDVREVRKARRQISNLFVTLNLGGVSALGFLASDAAELNPALAGWLIGALCLTCLIWRVSMGYFSRILSIKFAIIYEREHELGYNDLRREWETLARNGVLRWFALEKSMPILFVVGYCVFWAHLITLEEFLGMFQIALDSFTVLIEGLR